MAGVIFIVGAGTLGEIAAETARAAGLEIGGFFDDTAGIREAGGIPVVGTVDDLLDAAEERRAIFIAVGDNGRRRRCVERLRRTNVNFPNIVHPRAVVEASVQLGAGNLVLANTYLGTGSLVGSFSLFFPGSSITHHNTVGDYCFFAPNVSVGGYTQIGHECKFGMGSVVDPYLSIAGAREYSALTHVRQEGSPEIGAD